MPHWMSQLSLTLVAVSLAPAHPYRLPPRPAVMLRGALGKAMFDVACVRPDRDCRACLHRLVCPVATWYDPARAGGSGLRPFAISSLPTRDLDVDPDHPLLLRLGLATPPPRPSLLVEALTRAALAGLGPDRVPHRVRSLQVLGEGAPVEVAGGGSAWPDPAPLARFIDLPAHPRAARVHLRSPLQLPSGRSRPAPAAVLRAAMGRVRGVARLQGRRLSRWWPDVPLRWGELSWEDGSRWSARQGERVPLLGGRGVLIVDNAEPVADLLAAAEVLQIGKATTAGLGVLSIEWEGVEE